MNGIQKANAQSHTHSQFASANATYETFRIFIKYAKFFIWLYLKKENKKIGSC